MNFLFFFSLNKIFLLFWVNTHIYTFFINFFVCFIIIFCIVLIIYLKIISKNKKNNSDIEVNTSVPIKLKEQKNQNKKDTFFYRKVWNKKIMVSKNMPSFFQEFVFINYFIFYDFPGKNILEQGSYNMAHITFYKFYK